MAHSISRRRSVLFPAPEGPERITTLPEDAFAISFHVLDHLADALDRRFDFNHLASDLDVVGLRADRVRLARHLLGKEIELPPGALRLGS